MHVLLVHDHQIDMSACNPMKDAHLKLRRVLPYQLYLKTPITLYPEEKKYGHMQVLDSKFVDQCKRRQAKCSITRTIAHNSLTCANKLS